MNVLLGTKSFNLTSVHDDYLKIFNATYNDLRKHFEVELFLVGMPLVREAAYLIMSNSTGYTSSLLFNIN